MEIFKDPIILILFALLLVTGFTALQPRRRPEVWLIVLTILLFALPRAGVIIKQINLPLPLNYIFATVFIIEWLLLRKSSAMERSKVNYLFLLYAGIAGMGLAIGLTTGGTYLIALLELCFYLFAIGLFFYASETFCEQKHFYLFARLVLVISVVISLYGIAQRFLGSSVLVNYLTYNSSGDLARSYVEADEIGLRRVLSSYGDPNVLASQLVVFVGIGMALLLGKGVPSNTRLLCLFVVMVNVACTLYTGSRAGIMCLGLVLMVVLIWRTRWALLLIPLLVLIALMLGPALIDSVMASRFQSVITGDDARRQFPGMAWQLIQAVPFGCGLGNAVQLNLHGFNWSFAIVPAGVIWSGFNSFWLNLFSRLGLPGLITFIMLLWALVRYVSVRAKMIQDPQVRAFLIGGLAGFAGQWIIWIVNNTYMLPGGTLNFWFMMGMLFAGARAFSVQPQMVMLPLQYPVSKTQWMPAYK
jgi:hypothetical protein